MRYTLVTHGFCVRQGASNVVENFEGDFEVDHEDGSLHGGIGEWYLSQFILVMTSKKIDAS
jgi:hypothetical protein